MTEADQLSVDFARKYPEAFAKVLAQGEAADVVAVLAELPLAVAAAVAARLPVTRLAAVLATGDAAPAEWLEEASLDDALALLAKLPREQSLVLVNGLQNRRRRRRLLQFLNYPTHSVGALVADTLLRVASEDPIGDVLTELRTAGADGEQRVVVVDDKSRYLGVLDLWQLVVREPLVGNAEDYTLAVTPLRPETPVTSAARAPQWREHNWLPVVDHERRLLGWVARQRVLESADLAEQATPVLQANVTDLGRQLLRVLTELLGRVLAPRSGP